MILPQYPCFFSLFQVPLITNLKEMFQGHVELITKYLRYLLLIRLECSNCLSEQSILEIPFFSLFSIFFQIFENNILKNQTGDGTDSRFFAAGLLPVDAVGAGAGGRRRGAGLLAGRVDQRRLGRHEGARLPVARRRLDGRLRLGLRLGRPFFKFPSFLLKKITFEVMTPLGAVDPLVGPWTP